MDVLRYIFGTATYSFGWDYWWIILSYTFIAVFVFCIIDGLISMAIRIAAFRRTYREKLRKEQSDALMEEFLHNESRRHGRGSWGPKNGVAVELDGDKH